jgi:hypothetical protein
MPPLLYDDIPGVQAVPKKSLLKRRFDEEIAEPWVECDRCGYWFHQICALYSGLCAKDMAQVFACPLCVLESGKKPAVVSPSSNSFSTEFSSSREQCADMTTPCSTLDRVGDQRMWKASALPRTKLSDFLEAAVSDLLQHIGHSEVADTITIRMTSNYDNRFEVPSCVRDNFPTSDGNHVHEHIAFRQKCIQLFQTIDGVDVILFCLYVQEFDASCPPPNQSSVYIAYLDSVDYFRPCSLRTIVYQEIIVAYLKWSQLRGFKRCHLWSCPPQRGDNFIFWCHPSHQRTPSRDRLNSWYNAILSRCKAMKISKSTDKFWNVYFASCPNHRREEISCRQAAKHSFVGSGKAGKKSKANSSAVSSQGSVSVTTTESQEVSVSSTASSSSTISTITSERTASNVAVVSNNLICPPIFEGDYWMQEFGRLHRGMLQKDPLVGSAQAQSHYRWCRDMVKALFSKPNAAAFRQPVDPVALNVPTYFMVIQQPMDLGTVREKLRGNQYLNIQLFAQVRTQQKMVAHGIDCCAV